MYKKSNFSYNFSLPNVTFTEYKDIILYTYINKKIIQKFNSFIKFAILKGPKISVAIPIYNGVKYLYYYLRSIQNQKKKRNNKNKENRKVLYTKSIAALNARGKYIFQAYK